MLDIKTDHIGQTSLLHVHGRLDSINAEAFQKRLNEAIRSPRTIVLNLADVNYMSAAGLHVLKSLHEQLGTVRIAQPSNRVREVLQITGLDAVYKVYETQTEAIHAVRPIANAHTQLELSWLAEYCPDVRGMDFVPWLTDVVEKRWLALGSDWEKTFRQAAKKSIQKLIDMGTTMIGDISSTGKSIEPLLASGLRGIVYVELKGADPTKADMRLTKVQDIINQWRAKTQNKMHLGLAIHAPFSTHSDLWKKGLEYAKKENLPLCIPIAESLAEHAFMTKNTGAFPDTYFKDNPAVPSPGKSSIAYLEDIGALEQKPVLVHGVHVDDDDLKRIKSSGATMVHCPRSNLRLHGGRMPLEKYLEHDISVLLGTDSLASSPSLNVLDELEVAVALHHGKVEASEVMKLAHGTLPGTQ